MLCPLNSLQYSVNINFMKTLGNPKLLVTQLWYWLSFGVGNLSCSIFWVCLCIGIVSKSERNHVKLAWNVSCAHVPVQVNTVQIRCFFMLFSVYGVSQKSGWHSPELGYALKLLDWRTLPSVGEPEPMPPKTILIIIIQIKLSWL